MYYLTELKTWRRHENVLDKQSWLSLQHGGWIVARNWLHPYKRNSTPICGSINVARDSLVADRFVNVLGVHKNARNFSTTNCWLLIRTVVALALAMNANVRPITCSATQSPFTLKYNTLPEQPHTEPPTCQSQVQPTFTPWPQDKCYHSCKEQNGGR